MKYVYGNCDNPEDQVEYINAAHVFSDILALSQSTPSTPNPLPHQHHYNNPHIPPKSSTSPSQEVPPLPLLSQANKIFVINIQNGEIQIFWTALEGEYLSHVMTQGRPTREMGVELFHSRKFCVFSPAGLQAFIMEFGRVYMRIISR